MELLKETTGGKVGELVIEEKKTPKQITVSVSYERMNAIIGAKIPKSKVKTILTSLGFTVKDKGKDGAIVTVPEHRLDISIEEDIVEEIVRIYGVNKLTPAPMRMNVVAPKINTMRKISKNTRETMRALGFFELMLYSFYGDRERRGDRLSMFCDGRFDHLEVTKPLSPDQKFIRKSMLPGIVKSISKNIGTQGGDQIKVFELGKVFIPQGDTLPLENTMLAGGMTFSKKDTEAQLLYVKGVVESVLKSVKHNLKYTEQSLHDRGVVFEVEGKPIGMVYVLSSQELSEYKLKKPVTIFEVSLSLLEKYVALPKQYTEFSQFPSITRDLAVEIDQKILWGDVKKLLKGDSLETTTFLSQYALEDKKSLAFRMVFRSMKETLRSEVIDTEVKRITSLLENKINATIRGKK